MLPIYDCGDGLHPSDLGYSRMGDATLTWPREIPIDGEPADVVAIVAKYSRWLAESDMPKLFVNADPGVILTGSQREFCRTSRNQEEITVAGSHFIQEDSPAAIGQAARSSLAPRTRVDRLPPRRAGATVAPLWTL